MIDIFILTTKKNTFTFYFFNDKIFETHILKKNNGKYLVKFN